MVLVPIAFASMALTVWINDVPDGQKGGALAQQQFEYWYLQPLYPDDEIGLPPELVQRRMADVRDGSRNRFFRPPAPPAR
jgi:hypothetical protein